MSTQVLTLDELQVDQALGLDPFGALFAGRIHSDQRRVVILGVTSRPNLTESNLKQAIRAPLSVSHAHVAPLVGYGLLSEEAQGQLSMLLSQSLPPLSDDLPTLGCYLVYLIDATPLDELIDGIPESDRVRLVHELVSGLEALHKKRAHHLSLTLNSLWITAEGTLQITHCGVSAILKPRGLSLNRDAQRVPPHIAPRLRYASPEEVSGKLTNQICDLYSATYLAYELLTASKLLSEELSQEALAEAVISGVSSHVSPYVNEEWSKLFTRGLSVNTRERFTSAILMTRALQEVNGVQVMGGAVSSAGEVIGDTVGDPVGDVTHGTTPDISPVVTGSPLSPELSDELDFTMNEGDEELGDDPQASSMSLAVHSLRSQLSQQTSPTPQAQSGAQAEGIDELAFGAADQADEMAFGFSQDDVGERTFLEYSDVDEKTVFEQDLPGELELQQAHGLQSDRPQVGGTGQAQSMSTEFGLPSIELQAPDFLNGPSGALEPSRVLPIPRRAPQQPDMLGAPDQHAIPSQLNPALPQAHSAPPQRSEAPPVDHSSPHHAQPLGGAPLMSSIPTNATPSLDAQPLNTAPISSAPISSAPISSAPISSAPISPAPINSAPVIPAQATPSYMSSAQDWPGGDELQAYTPPDLDQPKPRARKAPRLKERAPLGKRLTALLVPSILILLGGFGIYWMSSHWKEFSRSLSELVESESVTHLQIASSPPEMTVWINGRPHTKTPAVFSYEERFSVGGQGFSVGDELKLKFVWRNKRTRKRRIHQASIRALAGESNLYFISSSKRRVKYAQTLIRSPQEVSRVSLDGQQIGQTPLIVIGPRDMSLSLEFTGLTLNERHTVKLGAPQSTELIVGGSAGESVQ